jgi:hypothetical protein
MTSMSYNFIYIFGLHETEAKIVFRETVKQRRVSPICLIHSIYREMAIGHGLPYSIMGGLRQLVI